MRYVVSVVATVNTQGVPLLRHDVRRHNLMTDKRSGEHQLRSIAGLAAKRAPVFADLQPTLKQMSVQAVQAGRGGVGGVSASSSGGGRRPGRPSAACTNICFNEDPVAPAQLAVVVPAAQSAQTGHLRLVLPEPDVEGAVRPTLGHPTWSWSAPFF